MAIGLYMFKLFEPVSLFLRLKGAVACGFILLRCAEQCSLFFESLKEIRGSLCQDPTGHPEHGVSFGFT